MAPTMILVDGNSLMYRAFHALPLLDNGMGVYTNAVYGFLSMLLKVLGETQPEYCAVAFDLHGPTFRHEGHEEYKAGRAPMPEELVPQMELIQRVLSAMHIELLTLPRYEADDLLGTLSLRCERQGMEALIITGDRDSFQLVSETTHVLYTKRGITDTERVTPAVIAERYGVTPPQLIDIKGLMGDASDNIPGVPGVGEKTACKLIQQYGSLELVLERAEAEQKGKLRERLMQFADQARDSKYLATIDREAPLAVQPGDCPLGAITDALPLLSELKLNSLIKRIQDRAAAGAVESLPSEARALEPLVQLTESGALASAALQLSRQPDATIYLGKNLSLAGAAGHQVVAMLGGDLLTPGLSEEEALRSVEPLLSAPNHKLTHDVKRLRARLSALNLPLSGEVEDVMLAAYAVEPQRKSFELEALLASEALAFDPEAPAAALAELYRRLNRQMEEQGLAALYREVELPLAQVLGDMEAEGFLVDGAELRRLGSIYSERLSALTEEIYQLAGGPLNINSPKQLGELLFDRLGLPHAKKTRTGYATGAEVLEELREHHPIVPLILEYRKYAKLNSTYIEALLRLQDATGRIHTSFDQTATATGRISSQEPNLQNIPVRTELGKDIRRAFVARPGWLLVDADYSQIELRVLAHMSGDQVMCEAFRMGQDIHRRTAAEVYGVPLEQVTPSMRSAAKAVNFGIVYGISDFGLARNIGISRGEAKEFIERYLARYPGVKRFMDGAVAQAKAQGYVTTLLGRRRYVRELNASSYTVRSFGERAAMNSPIQGTAADIIKLAMVQVHRSLREGGYRARLILQVHDELIVECPPEELKAVSALVRQLMEGVMTLSVPLQVDVSDGVNWYDCK